MKKSFFALLLTSIILIGCQSIQTTQVKPDAPAKIFDRQAFVPATAMSNSVYSLDLDSDGIEEKVIHYVNRDDIDGQGLFSKRDHINIYQLRENNWEINYEYIFPVINKDTGMRDWRSYVKEEPDTRIGSVSVIDVGNDGLQELMIKNESMPFGEWRFNSYEIIGKRNGEILILDLPTGPEKRDLPISFYGRPLDVDCVNGNIVEKWGGTCEGGVNPCYTFEFDISYEPTNGSWTISKSKNVQKVEAEWKKYEEQYGEVKWTGELSF